MMAPEGTLGALAPTGLGLVCSPSRWRAGVSPHYQPLPGLSPALPPEGLQTIGAGVPGCPRKEGSALLGPSLHCVVPAPPWSCAVLPVAAWGTLNETLGAGAGGYTHVPRRPCPAGPPAAGLGHEGSPGSPSQPHFLTAGTWGPCLLQGAQASSTSWGQLPCGVLGGVGNHSRCF